MPLASAMTKSEETVALTFSKVSSLFLCTVIRSLASDRGFMLRSLSEKCSLQGVGDVLAGALQRIRQASLIACIGNGQTVLLRTEGQRGALRRSTQAVRVAADSTAGLVECELSVDDLLDLKRQFAVPKNCLYTAYLYNDCRLLGLNCLQPNRCNVAKWRKAQTSMFDAYQRVQSGHVVGRPLVAVTAKGADSAGDWVCRHFDCVVGSARDSLRNAL